MVTIEQARKVLGEKYSHLSDDEVQSIVSSFDLLANGWLDKRERQIFKGKTIRELTAGIDND